MSKLHTLDHVFQTPHHYLPILLNLHGATDLTKVRQLAIADKPALLYAILMGFHMSKPQSRKSIPIIRELRHLKVNPRGHRQEAQRIFHVGQVDESMLRRWWNNQLDEAHLYIDADGKVTTKIAALFSYEPYGDYESELEMYQTLECPKCGQQETLREDCIEDLLACSSEFEHLSGPYCRCGACDEVVRVEINDARELPPGADYSDPEGWDFYVDWLAENLDLMAKHLVSYGKPDELYVAIGKADWRGRDAEAVCDFDAHSLAQMLRVNGEFCIRDGKLWLNPDGTASMSCVMYHHDVPTGSTINITPVWTCEVDSDRSVEMAEMLGNHKRAAIAEMLLCGADKAFEFGAGSTFNVVSIDSLVDSIEYLSRNLAMKDWEGIDLEGLDVDTALHCAIGWLLENLVDALRKDQPVPQQRVHSLRQMIDVYLAQENED